MRRHSSYLLITAVLAGLLVAGAAPTWAVTGWSTATQYAATSSTPSVAQDTGGDTVAGWCDGNGHPTAAYRAAGGAWDTPVTLETGGCDSGEPRLAIDSSGEAIAVWATASEIHAAIRTAGSGGSWGTPFVVSDTSGGAECLTFCTNPRVAVDTSGRATIVWVGTFQNGISWSPDAQLRTVDLSDGTLNPVAGPLVLSSHTQSADSVTLAENAGGTAAVAWLDVPNGGGVADPMWVTTVDTTTLPLAETTATQVNGTHAGLGSNSTGALDIAIDPSGTVSAAYPVQPTSAASPCPNAGCDLYVSDRDPVSGTWSAEALVASGASFSTHQLGFAPDGSELLVWADYSLACSGNAGACLMHSELRAGTADAWGSDTVISTRPAYSDTWQPTITADAGSAFTVTWRGNDTADAVALPEAARHDAGGWSAEHDLGVFGGGSLSGGYPVVAAGPAGDATAIWSDGAHLWYADYSAATQHTLSVTDAGTGSGAVTSVPAGIDCGATCGFAFDDGTPVTLSAAASPGSVFAGWTGGGCSGTGDCQVVVNADTAITATFSATTALTIGGSRTVGYGTSVTVSTTLTDLAHSTKIPGVSVTLQAKAPSASAWSTVANRTTSSLGTASVAMVPTATKQYRWHYSGTGYQASTSAIQIVSVAQVVLAHTTRSTVRHGVRFKIWGTVKPTHAGQTVLLQRLVGTVWRTVGIATLKTQRLPNGTTATGYVFTTSRKTTGVVKYRVVKPATATLAKGTSATIRVRIT